MLSKETTAGSLGTLGAGGGLSIVVSEIVVPYVEERIVKSEDFATNLSDYFKENKSEKEYWKEIMNALKNGCSIIDKSSSNIAVLKVRAVQDIDKDTSNKYSDKAKVKSGVEHFYTSVNNRRSTDIASVKFVCEEVDRILSKMSAVMRVYGGE